MDPDAPDHDTPADAEPPESDARVPEVLTAEIEALLADPDMWDEPDPSGLDRLLVAIESESGVDRPSHLASTGAHRARHVVLGAAAAALVMIVGVFVLSAVSNGDDTVLAVDLVPTGLAGEDGGRADFRQAVSGLRIALDAPGLPRCAEGSYYEAWVRTDDDRLVPVGTFHGGADVTLWAGVDLDRVIAFSVTLEQMATGDSAEHRSSGVVVLKATLPAASER